jgi:WD40-like Beta Propeller Repeat
MSNDEKGKTVNSDERPAKTASPRTGIFAAPHAFSGARGSGAPATRRLSRGAASVAILCASLLALAFTAASASAGLVHPYKSQITGTPTFGAFSEVRGIAVDPASQDVYVADQAGRVDVFSSVGVYQSQITGADIPGGEDFSPQAVAVSDKTGDVYVVSQATGGGSGVVYVFNAVGGAYVTKIIGIPGVSFSLLKGVAVDQSSGEVYVLDEGQKVVDRFNSANEYQSQLTLASQPNGVAVDSSGDVFVAESETESGEPAALNEFDSFGTQTLNIAGTPGGLFRQLEGVALDSAGNIYVTSQSGHDSVSEFDSTGAFVNETNTLVKSSTAPTGLVGYPTSVAVNAAGTMYVNDQFQNVVNVLGPNVLVPGVEGEPVTGVSDSGASLHGQVNPEGTEVVSCEFEYRTAAEPEFGHHSMACSPGTPYTGSANVPVGATLSNLEANTTYSYRLVASNAKGATGGPGYGPEESFTTPGKPKVGSVSAEVNPSEKIGQSTATLHASIDPDGSATTYTFEYGETTSYGTSIPFPPGTGTVGSEEAFVAVMAELTGLKIGTTYHYRVSASNEFGTVPSPDQTFSTLPAVLIESESVSDVAATSATLEAQIDPLGRSATCELQYVPDASFRSTGYQAAVTVPCPAALGEGEVGVPASVRLQSFTADTIYHYRAIATSSLGSGTSVVGEDHTFTTQHSGEPALLPDGRQWEMVSPPDKHGALLEGLGYTVAEQAAVGGGAMSYFAITATELGAQGQAEGAQVLSTRGPDGWSSRDIATPHGGPVGLATGRTGEYLSFSEDLSRSLVEPTEHFKPFSPLVACTATGCVPESFPKATEYTTYIRHDGTCASEVSSCYEPLLTGAPGYADVPSGVEFGEPYSNNTHDEFLGASPDLNSVVLGSEVGLTPGAPQHEELYEWSAGAPATERLQLVSVLPESEGGGPAPATENVTLGSDDDYLGSGWRPVSSDGSRIFWTKGEIGEAGIRLYMRDTTHGQSLVDGKEVAGETIRISAPNETPGTEALFQAASSDGSRVFFTDGGDLYVCEIVAQAGKDACELTNLTSTGSGESAAIHQLMPGTSDDGSYAYFVAGGVLSNGENGQKERAVPGANNLYMSHYDGTGWVTTFIATLSGSDEHDWSDGKYFGNIGGLTARVSPNGRYLAFMSNRSLTGYDNNDALTGRPDEEVYLYDAESGSHLAGSLVCASCNPTGARPAGVEVGQVTSSGAGNGNLVDVLAFSPFNEYNANTGIAANVPGGNEIHVEEGGSLYQPRYLSDSGRLFFNAADALVPQDVNGQEDVYEFEPEGIESPEGEVECSEGTSSGSDVYVPREHGCVGLISSGTSSQESGFLDASETGGDVFFLTKAKLVSADSDTALDVYDAHECASQAPCFPAPPAVSPPCGNAESCRAAPSPQPGIFGSPPSATFSGAGNVTGGRELNPPPPKKVTKKTVKCKRGFVKNKKHKCVREKKKTKARKASNNRRPGR